MINHPSDRTTNSSPLKETPDQPADSWPVLNDEAVQAPSIDVPSYFGKKYVLDRMIAALLLIPALPVMLLSAALIRATSRGAPVYRQKRVGLRGRVFWMYKIRTMVSDAEATSGPVWSTAADPRITKAGKLLRLLHLDELPQLYNVLRGEMSIVGPRPERPDFVRVLLDEVDGYADRLQARPGITGLAQIYLPPDETFDCVRKKVCYDRDYIRNASFGVDLQILMCTAIRIVGIRGGRGPRWFGLDRRFEGTRTKCELSVQPSPSRNGAPQNGQASAQGISDEPDSFPRNGHSSNGTASQYTRTDSRNGTGTNGRPHHPTPDERPGKPR